MSKTTIKIIIEIDDDKKPQRPWSNWDPRSGEPCPGGEESYADDPAFQKHVDERIY